MLLLTSELLFSSVLDQPSMFRVYCGNLSPAVNEGTLRDLFEEHDIEVAGNILVKRNYAFVDCADQVNVDKAIDKLNRKLLMYNSFNTAAFSCKYLQEAR